MTQTHTNQTVLHNPFKRGDTLRIPAGATYTSMHPSADGPQQSKRAATITLHDASQGYIDNSYHAPDDRIVAQPILLTTGTGQYWKRYTLTEDILRANNLDPTYDVYEYIHGRYQRTPNTVTTPTLSNA